MQPVNFQFKTYTSQTNITLNKTSFKGLLNYMEFRNKGAGNVTINGYILEPNETLVLQCNENEAIESDFNIVLITAASYNLKIIAKTYVL